MIKVIEEREYLICSIKQAYSICIKCGDEGHWMDPAGGVHYPDEDDPCSQYE